MDFWQIGPGEGGTAMEMQTRYALPITGCPCARVRCSDRLLPIECPPEWRGRPEVTPRRGHQHRVHSSDFEPLRAALEPCVRGALPPELLPLQPGDRFGPGLLARAPRPRRADFLWPGLMDTVVSERVRALWEEQGFTGAVFARTEFAGRAPMLSSGAGQGEYFHLTVTATSGLPPGVDPADASVFCPACGDWTALPRSGAWWCCRRCGRARTCSTWPPRGT